MIPIVLRSIVDHLMARERQFERITDEPPAYDTTSFPIELALPARLYRADEMASMVTVHVTDVTGGFGVSGQALKRWKNLVALNKVSAELARQRPVGTSDGDWAYVLALLERYSRCAYHRIISRRVGIVANHPLSLRTSHGNGGNAGPGFAIDCGHGESLSEALIAAARDGLEDLILDTYQATDETVVVAPHRAFSGARRVDTAAIVWAAVVRPVVDRIREDYEDVCRIDYELAVGSGRPVPLSWDDRALFNDKGRRLPAAA